jgi:hypothetical protein
MCCLSFCVSHADATGALASNVEQPQQEQQLEPNNSAEGVLNSSNCWSRLAAAIPADIPEQPALLTGGQLREYQMQVRQPAWTCR